MSPAQLAEWAEYESVEPFGFPGEDARLGILASAVARGAGADMKPTDFMLDPPEPPLPTPEEFAKQLAQMLGAVPVPRE